MAGPWKYSGKSQKARRLERTRCGWRYRMSARYWRAKEKRQKARFQKKLRHKTESVLLFLLFLALIAGICYFGLK